MIHRRRKVDANQSQIVDALRKIGCCVIDLSASGDGVMDLLVCYRRRTWMVEVKNLKGRGDILTPAQIKLHAAICDAGCEVHIIYDIEGAIALVTKNDNH